MKWYNRAMNEALAIITVVYKNYDVLKDFFSTLDAQTFKNFKVYVADLSPEPQAYQYPPYAVCIKGENHGYAHGVNIGIQQAIKDGLTQFCVINSDIVFANNFIINALKALQHHPKDILGGKIYYAKDYEFHKDRYTEEQKGHVIWFAGGSIDWANVFTKHIGVDEVDAGQYNLPKEVDFITGCLMLYTKQVHDIVGKWDPSYFLYYEDTDFCVRAHKKGIKLLYEPSLVIAHKNAQSTDGSGSYLHVKYQTKNRITFGLKYAPLKTKLHLLKNAVTEAFHTQTPDK